MSSLVNLSEVSRDTSHKDDLLCVDDNTKGLLQSASPYAYTVFRLDFEEEKSVVVPQLDTYLGYLQKDVKNAVAILPFTNINVGISISYRALCTQIIVGSETAENIYNLIKVKLIQADLNYQQEVSREVVFRVIKLKAQLSDDIKKTHKKLKEKEKVSLWLLSKPLSFIPKDYFFYNETKDVVFNIKEYTFTRKTNKVMKDITKITNLYGKALRVNEEISVSLNEKNVINFQDYIYKGF
jgi:hypothetical protein